MAGHTALPQGGVFEVDGSALRGFAAVRSYAEVHARLMRTRHMTVNHL